MFQWYCTSVGEYINTSKSLIVRKLIWAKMCYPSRSTPLNTNPYASGLSIQVAGTPPPLHNVSVKNCLWRRWIMQHTYISNPTRCRQPLNSVRERDGVLHCAIITSTRVFCPAQFMQSGGPGYLWTFFVKRYHRRHHRRCRCHRYCRHRGLYWPWPIKWLK